MVSFQHSEYSVNSPSWIDRTRWQRAVLTYNYGKAELVLEKYEGTFRAITSSLSWVCDSLRRERSGKLETFKVLRLPPLTLDETLMPCFWDVK